MNPQSTVPPATWRIVAIPGLFAFVALLGVVYLLAYVGQQVLARFYKSERAPARAVAQSV